MPNGTPTDRARVALVGQGDEASRWHDLLAHPSIDLVHLARIEDVAASECDWALVAVGPGALAGIEQAVAEGAAGTPVAMLVLPAQDQHPLTGWVAALARAKQEWQQVFDALVEPVAVLHRDGTISRANQAFAQLAGRPFAEIIAAHYVTLLGEATAAGSDPIAAALSEQTAIECEATFARVPGVLRVTTSPLADARGGGLILLLRDVTEDKQTRARLELSHRLADIGRLAGGVAHEISTPLASIALRAESLQRKAQDERLQGVEGFKDFPRYLKTIEEETFRCKKIIGALLEFSRARQSERVLTDISHLTERAVALISDQMRAKRITLALKLGQELPQAPVDPGQIREALIALLLNALDATSAGGRVEVETRLGAAGFIAISVADNGTGIPEEYRDKIFAPFFTTKPVGQGTGLGLAICDGIVRTHNGHIEVQSQVERGSRFTLHLPAGGHGSGVTPGAA